MKLKNWWRQVIDVQELMLWHPDSPGMKVKVRRNRFQRWFYEKHFATLSESLLRLH